MGNSERKEIILISIVISILLFSSSPALVDASFGGSDVPSYSDSGVDSYQDFVTRSASASTGECEIKVNALPWPWFYAASTNDRAWVGCAYEMDVYQTDNWWIEADWTLDYKLTTRYDCKVYIEVWYVVRQADGSWYSGFKVWDDEQHSSGATWQSVSDIYTPDPLIEQGFGYNLNDNTWYKFCIELRVWLYYAGRDYKVTDYSGTNGATLTVNEVSWYEY